MAPENRFLNRFANLLMVVLSCGMVEIIALEISGYGKALINMFAWFVAGLFGQKYLPRLIHSKMSATLLSMGVLLAPFFLEVARRSFFGEGYPFEIQMVFGLRNMAMIFTMLATQQSFQKLAALASLALILFGSLMSNEPVGKVILAFYTVVGSVWLMCLYWAGLGKTAYPTRKDLSIKMETMPVVIPLVPMGVLFGTLIILGVLMAFRPAGLSVVLAEIMPTSGGSGKLDIFARHGVGNGPEETAGVNAQSAGMVETDKSIEDNNNSLIDAVSETFGPPKKPPENREKMVAAGLTELIEIHGRVPENRTPSRDFDTRRFSPKKAEKPESRQARGIYEVEGKTPLHIRVVAYEFYDWNSNRWVEGRKPLTRNIEQFKGDWMQLLKTKTERNWYGANEFHRMKFANPWKNLGPTPSFMEKFRIHRVDRPDYFEWEYEDVLVVGGRKSLPSGLIVNTECRTLNSALVPAEMFVNTSHGDASAPMLVEISKLFKEEYLQISREVAGSEPRGWKQVQNIIDWLRNGFHLNQKSTAPDEHSHPALWFLKESKSGPDYLFATSAAMLLRSLGYPTRVCLGYYASPGSFDPKTLHTPVRDTDLHVWPEILLKDGNWMVLEPTPGYEVLAMSISWIETIQNAISILLVEVMSKKVPILLLFILLFSGFLLRKRMICFFDLVFWVIFPSKNPRKMVLRAFSILERRMSRQGKLREPAVSPSSWVRRISQETSASMGLTDFPRMLEWSAYAPLDLKPWPNKKIADVCQLIVKGWK